MIAPVPVMRRRPVAPAARRALRALGGLALAACAQLASAQSGSPYAVLQGRWVRPDGGYTITIRSADAAGRLDASYANPTPLPFHNAEATLNGKTLKLFFELRAGGYQGSTYTLTYDPAHDTLDGVYYQAVAQQKYDVRFVRAGPSSPGPAGNR